MDSERKEEPRSAGRPGPRLNELLFQHRRQAELTQEKLSELAGVSYQTISNIERGLGHRPRPSTVRQLADALRLDPSARAAFEEAARAWPPGPSSSTSGERPDTGATLPGRTPTENGSMPVATETVEDPTVAPSATDRGRRRRVAWLAAIAVSVATTAAALSWATSGRQGSTPRQPYALTSLGTFDSHPALIAKAPDGTLWFTMQYGDSIWKLPRGGAPTLVFGLQPGSHPFGITTAPDGSVWFTEGEADGSSGDAVGKLNPDGTLAHRTPLPKGSQPIGIVVAPDGRVWFTA